MLPELETLLAYRNEHVIMRYAADFPESSLSAEEAFCELKKYMWMCLKLRADRKKDPGNQQLLFECRMHEEMLEIDNMWHTFLLFTREYQDFCNNHLGEFFHHSPLVSEKEISDEDYEAELSAYLDYVYENLGEETIIKWFFPEQNPSIGA